MFLSFPFSKIASLLDQRVWQSSTEGSAIASRAIDGITLGNINQCTQTGPELRAWWSVDLGARRKVHGVVLFTRNDETGIYFLQFIKKAIKLCSTRYCVTFDF